MVSSAKILGETGVATAAEKLSARICWGFGSLIRVAKTLQNRSDGIRPQPRHGVLLSPL